MKTLRDTNYKFSENQKFHRGKVRDIYQLGNKIVMISTDRLSAFDVVLPKGIPFKGQVINQIANFFLESTKDIVPNWLEATPDPNVSVGKYCIPFKVEMVIRQYLSGHLARIYASGKREISGVVLPEGLKENDKLPKPIITPSTKAEQGLHDQDISKEEILEKKLVTEEDYQKLETYTRILFEKGTQMAKERDLILVDTKYEFGKDSEGKVRLIDEVHTPDSSRYFYLKGYEKNQKEGLPQKQLSKEFVRKWLMERNYSGKEEQIIPDLKETFIKSTSDRYIELYESVTGLNFEPASSDQIDQRIEENIKAYIDSL